MMSPILFLKNYVVEILLIISGIFIGNQFYQKAHIRVYKFIKTNESVQNSKLPRILCLMLTYPSNLDKIKTLKETWVRKCDRIMLISEKYTEEFEFVPIEYPKEARENLWRKVIRTFIYAHDNLIDQFDWFMKMDDDTYVLMENLKEFLTKYDTNKPYYFGK